ncbi:hypothetical protein [Aggregatibacter sp. oral taxon 458]|uniref:hypothetical protein n=1 Tax=Aggregatibacter sp. oral taxon 458 TaxID=712148 RepID=UPI0025BF8209|nr:hypothetical protein [Aggregatibacter sp. oral taxon 458]
MHNPKIYAYIAVFFAMVLPLFFTDHYWWDNRTPGLEIFFFFILPVILSCSLYFWVNTWAVFGSALSLICVFLYMMTISNEGRSDWAIMLPMIFYPIGSIGAFIMSLFPLIFDLKGFKTAPSAVIFSAVFTLTGFAGLYIISYM